MREPWLVLLLFNTLGVLRIRIEVQKNSEAFKFHVQSRVGLEFSLCGDSHKKSLKMLPSFHVYYQRRPQRMLKYTLYSASYREKSLENNTMFFLCLEHSEETFSAWDRNEWADPLGRWWKADPKSVDLDWAQIYVFLLKVHGCAEATGPQNTLWATRLL